MRQISKKDLYIYLAGCGYMLWKLDEIKDTSLYSKSIKMNVNRLVVELEKQESMICDFDNQADNFNEAMQEMQDSYQYFENWFNTIFDVPHQKKASASKCIELIVSHFTDAELTNSEKNVMAMLENVTK